MSAEIINEPEIRFKGYTEDWEQRELSDLMIFSNGINAPKESYGKGRKMISVMDILDTRPIEYKNIRNSVLVDEKIETKNKVEKGDLIFVRSSEVLEEVGWAKAYSIDEYALYSGFSIRGKKINTFNAHFVELTLNFASRKQIERKAGGSTRFNTSQAILNSIEIFMPKIEEQNEIDSLITQLDNTITFHQHELDLLKQTKQSYLQKMFPKDGENKPELRFTGFTDTWEQRKVFQIAKDTFGEGTPKTSVKEFWNGDIPWIQSSDLETNKLFNVSPKKKITSEAVQKSATKIIPSNSIAIVTRVGVGKLALMSFEYATSQDFLSLSELQVDPYFGSYCLYSMLQKELNNIQGTSIKGMTKSDLLEKKLMVPRNAEEQEKIGTFFKQLDDTIALHQRKLDILESMKKSLLKQMFI